MLAGQPLNCIEYSLLSVADWVCRGPGVVGQKPILRPGQYFQYVSVCPLGTTTGTMEGDYEMVVLNDAQEITSTITTKIAKFGLNMTVEGQI